MLRSSRIHPFPYPVTTFSPPGSHVRPSTCCLPCTRPSFLPLRSSTVLERAFMPRIVEESDARGTVFIPIQLVHHGIADHSQSVQPYVLQLLPSLPASFLSRNPQNPSHAIIYQEASLPSIVPIGPSSSEDNMIRTNMTFYRPPSHTC